LLNLAWHKEGVDNEDKKIALDIDMGDAVFGS
jgi:hypothetical protein